MLVALSRVHFPVTTLGPGRRVGIWFQGCSIRCPGCVSADTWAPGRSAVSVEEVAADLAPILEDAAGVTVSGGEPFDQPDALAALLRALPLSSHHDVLVFTGYAWERVASSRAVRDGRIDALVTDPYDPASSQTLPLRGSDNQHLHLLTPRGRERFATYDTSTADVAPALDVMFDADGTVWLAGIPRPGDMERFRDLLVHAGHDARTTQATTRKRPR